MFKMFQILWRENQGMWACIFESDSPGWPAFTTGQNSWKQRYQMQHQLVTVEAKQPTLHTATPWANMDLNRAVFKNCKSPWTHSVSFRFIPLVPSCSLSFRDNNTSQFLETDVIQGLAVCTRHCCCDSYTCSKVTKISDQDRSFLSNVSNLLDLPALSQGRRLSVHR